MDLTKGSQNPMDSVSFFHHAESTEKVSLRAKQISTMFPLSNLVRILPTVFPALFLCTADLGLSNFMQVPYWPCLCDVQLYRKTRPFHWSLLSMLLAKMHATDMICGGVLIRHQTCCRIIGRNRIQNIRATLWQTSVDGVRLWPPNTDRSLTPLNQVK